MHSPRVLQSCRIPLARLALGPTAAACIWIAATPDKRTHSCTPFICCLHTDWTSHQPPLPYHHHPCPIPLAVATNHTYIINVTPCPWQDDVLRGLRESGKAIQRRHTSRRSQQPDLPSPKGTNFKPQDPISRVTLMASGRSSDSRSSSPRTPVVPKREGAAAAGGGVDDYDYEPPPKSARGRKRVRTGALPKLKSGRVY